uniref:uncharacterized protein LOC122610542 n=1 Tax=Erigeron canadensis TaxID=72917 RepID=UPI001CB90426|nr:uncharacterized protein LOC122610542 [Erigeron canadensis]
MDQTIRHGAVIKTAEVGNFDNKRKWDGNQGRNFTPRPFRKPDNIRAYNAGPSNNMPNKGNSPVCGQCKRNHQGPGKYCEKCKRYGHLTRDCKTTPPTNIRTAPGEFTPSLNITPDKLDAKYTVELANGKLMSTDKIFQECTINLDDRLFPIDFKPARLGSFDIIIGMDWLSKHHAEILCCDKAIRIPLPNGEVIIIQGEKSGTPLNIISCMKARKCLKKGYFSILAHVKEKNSDEKQLEEVPVVKEFPDVFPEELPGLPPSRQVEFHVDLAPGAKPVA